MSYHIISVVYRMSDDLTPEQERLSARASVAQVKTSLLKKGLARQKNLLAAKKKDIVGKHLQPPEELTVFLQDQATIDKVLQAADEDKQAILVRRYVKCLCNSRLVMTIFFTSRFLMCYLVYTNFQREGSVMNMTAQEVNSATKSKDFYVISVWQHKTANSHGAARIAVRTNVYQLLQEYMGSKTGADLVFVTNGGEKVTHIAFELEQLGLHFGKKFSTTPTLNRKQMATHLAKTATETDVRGAAAHMTHSLAVHQSTYQHCGGADESVNRYVCELTVTMLFTMHAVSLISHSVNLTTMLFAMSSIHAVSSVNLTIMYVNAVLNVHSIFTQIHPASGSCCPSCQRTDRGRRGCAPSSKEEKEVLCR